jgi:hypothetical protein
MISCNRLKLLIPLQWLWYRVVLKTVKSICWWSTGSLFPSIIPGIGTVLRRKSAAVLRLVRIRTRSWSHWLIIIATYHQSTTSQVVATLSNCKLKTIIIYYVTSMSSYTAYLCNSLGNNATTGLWFNISLILFLKIWIFLFLFLKIFQQSWVLVILISLVHRKSVLMLS